MREPHDHEERPELESADSSEGVSSESKVSNESNEASDPLEELYAHYVDLLNRGESIEPADILAAHPEQGTELLEMLE